ncbi:MAG TPA: DUF928 domain-containing protein [Leptolyngbyaceae cyanobacterium]
MTPHCKPRVQWRKWSSGILVGLLVSVGSLSAAYAQTQVKFNVPDIEAPGNRESAAQRGSSEECLPTNTPLMAIVPETNIGLTTAAYPSVYVYVPPTAAKTARFVIFDEATNTSLYEEEFAIDVPDGGIVTVSLPNNGIQQPLKVNQTYYWYFSLECDADDPDANPVVESNIQRVDPTSDLSESLAISEPQTLPLIYAEAGIWYDALAASADLSESNPSEANSGAERTPRLEWRDLLQSVGLTSIANSPLLGE